MEEGLNEDDIEKGSDHGDRMQAKEPAHAYGDSDCNRSTPFHKVTAANADDITPKVEQPPPPPSGRDDATVFLAPTSKSKRKSNTTHIRQQKPTVYELDSSDEDEVVEVALPPKPTITIDSSDEDDIVEVVNEPSTSSNGRHTAASRSPSVVSSMSDEFMRNDCIALNISQQEKPSFDFSLHGSDLLDQDSPSKKKKKKKNKTKESPIATPAAPVTLFATPRSKSKKKHKCDNGQPRAEHVAAKRRYTALSVPSADVYETDSNQSTVEQREVTPDPLIERESVERMPIVKDGQRPNQLMIDLTKEPFPKEVVEEPIESIVIANVSGMADEPTHMAEEAPCDARYGSTRVPAILLEDLDFDNMKGHHKSVSKKRYSVRALRMDMDKFYNESWGGENFNHMEIQKYMSRDKSLWAIDPRDRCPNAARKKNMCYQCNRTGHRDDQCRMRPAVCHMCGMAGHHEPRCPTKICVNCGSSNFVYSAVCHNCTDWGRMTCPECGQYGHPYTHCPDLWRRYHNTTENITPLVENRDLKQNYQQYCSGCARRGHLVHSCRNVYPFSGLPINNPHVSLYRPVYATNVLPNKNFNSKPTLPTQRSPSPVQKAIKRQSISPLHPNHEFKRRSMSDNSNVQSQANAANKEQQRVADVREPVMADAQLVTSSNRDKKGHMIQDNQVSDTSNVVTTARVYLMKDVLEKLKQPEGVQWMRDVTTTHKVTVTYNEGNAYLCVTGDVGGQESFQNELKAWIKGKPAQEDNKDQDDSCKSFNIPKNRNNVLKQLNDAFISLEADIGDPKKLFKELNYLQKNHKQLLKQRIVNPVQLTNNRNNINKMLRKLNMILLGQAGLADGSKHLQKLQALQEKVTSCKQKYLTKNLRQEIGEHYHIIFAAAPRDDYSHLLKMYYQKSAVAPNGGTNKGPPQKQPINTILSKLSHIHKRVGRTQPSNDFMKKTRNYLLRMLHHKIIVLSKEHQVSHKVMKKLTKIQEQSQVFLSNV